MLTIFSKSPKGKSFLDIYKCPFCKSGLRLLEKSCFGCIIEN